MRAAFVLCFLALWAPSALAVPGTIGTTLTPAGSVAVGDTVVVTFRMSGRTDQVEVDGFNFEVTYDAGLFSFVANSFSLGTSTGANQQWLSLPNQETASQGFTLTSTSGGATPGNVAITVGDTGANTPERGTIANSGFLISFSLRAIAPGTSAITPKPRIDMGVLLDGNHKPLPTPALTGASITVTADEDFGDAPEIYPTLLGNNGARHVIVKGFQLGARIDSEVNGQPSGDAKGDDAVPVGAADDEDGVVFTSPLVPGQTATVEVISSDKGFLNAWVDFNNSGSWVETDEQIFIGTSLNQGTNSLAFFVPASAKGGATFARFRLSRQPTLRFDGPAPDGEVEDYQVSVDEQFLDFGDAPDGPYPTTLKNNGARHQIAEGFVLGQFIDGELDGQPSLDALGDDGPPVIADDEDGVTFKTPLIPGQTATVEVVGPLRGRLDAWVDFNLNGSWADEGDHIFVSVLLSSGVNVLQFTVPTFAKTGATYARFRLSRQGGLNFDGPGRDGEVEDYRVAITERPTQEPCDRTNEGTDFWLTFPANYAPDPAQPVRLSLCITGLRGTTGTVAIPGLGFLVNFVIPPSNEVVIVLPKEADLADANDLVEKKGIHVTASALVAVFGLNHVRYTTDGYLGLPSDVLGKEYIIQGYRNVHTAAPDLNGTQFALVACEDNTKVTIIPSVTTGARTAGVPYTINLNSGETYQLRSTNDAPSDLSGTIVSADKPLAVFGSHLCANIPTAAMFFCDYIVEQLLPTSRWGNSFLVMPLQTRTGDTYRCLAAQDGTTVFVNGLAVAALNRGETFQFVRSTPAEITSDKPIFVAQYANSSDFDGVVKSDPFMLTIPPSKMFRDRYLVCTAKVDFPDNYINVIAPAAAVGSVLLDGVAIPAGSFAAIGASGYSGAKLAVGIGPHGLSGPLPFGLSVYGFAEYDSYAWPGGLSFGDAAPPTVTCLVSNVTITLGQSTAGGCLALAPNFTQEVAVGDNCDNPDRLKVEQKPSPGTPVPPGIHPVTLSVTDSSGNTGSCVIQLTVVDTSPIVSMQCPSNIVALCKSRQGAEVTFAAGARTLCGTVVPVECAPHSGSLFPVGTTPVVCVANASAGQQLTCAFSVTVGCLSVSRPSLGKVVVAWPLGNLQRADSITGPWSDVRDAVSPYSAPAGNNTHGFFRLKL